MRVGARAIPVIRLGNGNKDAATRPPRALAQGSRAAAWAKDKTCATQTLSPPITTMQRPPARRFPPPAPKRPLGCCSDLSRQVLGIGHRRSCAQRCRIQLLLAMFGERKPLCRSACAKYPPSFWQFCFATAVRCSSRGLQHLVPVEVLRKRFIGPGTRRRAKVVVRKCPNGI